MVQEIITYAIIAIVAMVVVYNIYKKIWGKCEVSSKCNGCSGCGETKVEEERNLPRE